jgi:sucrose-6-phosphate hydrolase SacC (GH32 family)
LSGATGHPPQRPRVHFTPPAGWMNDPNGLVWADGVFHLCYQHHPDDLLWGPMHWGHATSTDLFSWEHRPIVLRPDHLGTAFSGSAVVDHDGVAGFGTGALVAFYTHFGEETPQSQGVAASTDGGETWTPYDANPVLSAPEGLLDFRDPKVFWHPDGHWVMVLVGGDEAIFHRSEDLLHWTECGRFGRGYGAHGGVWETPDLFELEVEGTGESRWVLVVSVLGGGPAGGSGTQWFLGDFDGATFTPHDAPEVVRWVDHGADFYAPQSWSGVPDGRRIWLAWMSNWDYARTTPASTWRGAMTLPREVRLRRDDDGVVLVQAPVRELDGRRRVVAEHRGLVLAPDAPWRCDPAPEAYDLRLRRDPAADGAVEVVVHAGAGEATRVRWDPAGGSLRVTRPVEALAGAGAVQEVALPATEVDELRIVVDTCSVEVFAAGGAVVLTDQVFPAPGDRGLAVRAVDGELRLAELVLADLG